MSCGIWKIPNHNRECFGAFPWFPSAHFGKVTSHRLKCLSWVLGSKNRFFFALVFLIASMYVVYLYLPLFTYMHAWKSTIHVGKYTILPWILGVLVSNASGSRGTASGSRAPWNSMLVDDRPRAWFNWAMKKGPLVVLGFIGDEILPSYVGITSILKQPVSWVCARICTPPTKKNTWQWKITIFDRRYIFKWLFFPLSYLVFMCEY